MLLCEEGAGDTPSKKKEMVKFPRCSLFFSKAPVTAGFSFDLVDCVKIADLKREAWTFVA